MRLTTNLVCSACGHTTVHEVHYAGDALHEIRCRECSSVVYAHHRLVIPFMRELGVRVVTKPYRLLAEVLQDPGSGWRLPGRIVSKPLRMAREALEVLR